MRKVRFIALAKAFNFWARDFNNAVQIEELTKQVQERTKVLRIVREAYMRDVIGCVYACCRHGNQKGVKRFTGEKTMSCIARWQGQGHLRAASAQTSAATAG